MPNPQFLLVEPIAKTPFPPLGLMKISTMLKRKHKICNIFAQVGNSVSHGLLTPEEIYITSLFTWDLDSVVKSIHFYQDKFPSARINVGGVAATLMPDYLKKLTGIEPHIGLLEEAEVCPPDYGLTFGRELHASLTFTSRGCPRGCKFCSVRVHEPSFIVREDWEKDLDLSFPRIVFWDNNWLASKNFKKDCEKIKRLGKFVDFNQGLDARLYSEGISEILSNINLDPIRFAFDSVNDENAIIKAIRLAKKTSNREVRVYVLYNFEDSPEDFYYRINLLNKEEVLSFPMEYRKTTSSKTKYPGPYWNIPLLRAFKLSLHFYYRKGMITESRKSFQSIYGKTAKDFIEKLYSIYEYDKSRTANNR